jgi:hypothetical protein
LFTSSLRSLCAASGIRLHLNNEAFLLISKAQSKLCIYNFLIVVIVVIVVVVVVVVVVHVVCMWCACGVHVVCMWCGVVWCGVDLSSSCLVVHCWLLITCCTSTVCQKNMKQSSPNYPSSAPKTLMAISFVVSSCRVKLKNEMCKNKKGIPFMYFLVKVRL